jgi:hypothetical protein
VLRGWVLLPGCGVGLRVLRVFRTPASTLASPLVDVLAGLEWAWIGRSMTTVDADFILAAGREARVGITEAGCVDLLRSGGGEIVGGWVSA